MDIGFVSVGCHPRLFMFFPFGEIGSKAQLQASLRYGEFRDAEFGAAVGNEGEVR